MFIRVMYSTLFQISSRFFFMSTFNSISLWKPLNHFLFLLSFLFGNHFSICNGNKLNLCCRLNIIYHRGISSMYTAVFSSLFTFISLHNQISHYTRTFFFRFPKHLLMYKYLSFRFTWKYILIGVICWLSI